MAFVNAGPTTDPTLLGFQQGLYDQSLLSNYPGGNVIRQRLAGQVPADVLANLYQTSAEKGYSTGMPGGSNVNAATMRALGLTSYGIQSDALNNLHQILPQSPQYPLGSPGTLKQVPNDTGAPLGGAPAAGGGGLAAAGKTPAAGAEPAAPMSSNDAWTADWMRRQAATAKEGMPGSLSIFGPTGIGTSSSAMDSGTPYSVDSNGSIYMGGGGVPWDENADYWTVDQSSPAASQASEGVSSGYGSDPGVIDFSGDWLERLLGNYGVTPAADNLDWGYPTTVPESTTSGVDQAQVPLQMW